MVMRPVMREFHIEDEAGNRDGEKERGWVCGCGCGCGWGDAACGGGYVCSCFVGAKAETCMKVKRKLSKEWTIAFCVYICIGTMQGIKVSKQGARLVFITLIIMLDLVWVIIMSRTNESDALPINRKD